MNNSLCVNNGRLQKVVGPPDIEENAIFYKRRNEFVAILALHQSSYAIHVSSITKMTDGYLLAVRYDTTNPKVDHSFVEMAVWVYEEKQGLRCGLLAIGWTRTICALDGHSV